MDKINPDSINSLIDNRVKEMAKNVNKKDKISIILNNEIYNIPCTTQQAGPQAGPQPMSSF